MTRKHGIVVTTDFSPESRRALKPAAALAHELGLAITLVHVVEDLQLPPHGAPLAPPQSTPTLTEEVEAARRVLEQMVEETDLQMQTEVLTGPDIAKAVTEFAAEHKADYLAVSTHGRTGLRHMILGSVAEAILRHARTPVICYPAT